MMRGISGFGALMGVSGNGNKWDIVLAGGAVGSLFSFCQFLVSPFIGSLSDKYGRKRVLVVAMVCT